jgi:hypothetical protein
VQAILADVNVQGHLGVLVTILESPTWRDLWHGLGLAVKTLRSLGLTPGVPDDTLWHTCQREEVALITANRSADEPDSLEATLGSHGTPESLPVFTLAHADRVLTSREYAERAAARLLDYLLNIDRVRGAGRLYLP